MAVRSPLSKRETSVEKKKLAEVSQPSPKPKAKTKVKVKAKAKAAKVPGTVLLLNKTNDEEEKKILMPFKSLDKLRGGA